MNRATCFSLLLFSYTLIFLTKLSTANSENDSNDDIELAGDMWV